MRVASSTMVAKEMRKPLLLHMEQKNWSSRQSSSLGKGLQIGSSTEEQLLWRPMYLVNVEPVSAVTEYDTQCGVRMDTIVKTVAVGGGESFVLALCIIFLR